MVRITSQPGETFVDRMIALVEGAARQRTPNEIALNVLLASLSIVFVLVTLTLNPIAGYVDAAVSLPVLIALLVCLIPTTIGALLSAIGIAGMDRLVQHNVLAMSGRAVEAAGDVTTLLLDKTGTITYGNRRAVDFLPLDGVSRADLDARRRGGVARRPDAGGHVDRRTRRRARRGGRPPRPHATVVPFTAQTRMSGVDQRSGTQIRKGAGSAVIAWVEAGRTRSRPRCAPQLDAIVERISVGGGTPLVVAIQGASVSTRESSAWCTSRTSSRAASRSASRSSARWASAP